VKIRWTVPATRDLASIFRYICKDKPGAARHVKASISEQVSTLASMPFRGRIGSVDGTREMIFHPWPYIAVYRVLSDEVQIIRIRHAAQEWPLG
jgi:addiction module RelE/StbE family toxin